MAQDHKIGMKPGDRVEKIKGYPWPGEVRAVFKTKAGAIRVVVECTHPVVAGALHIFAPEQLHAVDGRDEPSLCSDCPPVNYPTDETRCTPCPRRGLKQ